MIIGKSNIKLVLKETPVKYSLARRIFNSAVSFEGAATLTEHPIPKSPRQYWWPIQPTIVNFILALELYLKCLLTIKGKEFRKNHQLSEFFKALDGRSQKHIAAQLRYQDISLFLTKVTEIDRALIEWRYIYEYDNKQIDIEFLKAFCRITKAYIVENHASEINEA